MTVGRKGHGHRPEEFDDDNLSENSDHSSLSSLPPAPDLPAHGGRDSSLPHRHKSYETLPNQHRLPNFETFLRDTFHQRSTSMPGPTAEHEMQGASRELQVHNSARPGRTMSGTWLKEHRSLNIHLQPQPPPPERTIVSSRPLPVQPSLSTFTHRTVTNSQAQSLPFRH
jgi:hypothetical protein